MAFSLFFGLACGYFGHKQGWLRLCGVGLAWKGTATHPLSFSQRNGLAAYWRVGRGWVVYPLAYAKCVFGGRPFAFDAVSF